MVCLSLFGRQVRPQHHRHGHHSESSPPVNENDRREYVSKVLVVKHVIRQEPSSDEEEQSTSTAEEQSSSEHEIQEVEEKPIHLLRQSYIKRLKSNLILSDADELDATRDSTKEPWMCAICLNAYEIGEEICWSKNSHCRHVFHHECIEEWLLKHDNCPCCREDYLASEDADHEEETKTEHVLEHSNNRSHDVENPPERGRRGPDRQHSLELDIIY
jgi:hypothetical protein